LAVAVSFLFDFFFFRDNAVVRAFHVAGLQRLRRHLPYLMSLP
jgi:hypothetical protein